jgi:hypothetical protein
MHKSQRSSLALGLAAGMTVTTFAAVLMGQGTTPPGRDPTQPTRPEAQPGSRPDMQPRDLPGRMGGEYFVTGEMGKAHLWVRDGSSLRWVSSAEQGNSPTPRTPGSDRPRP